MSNKVIIETRGLEALRQWVLRSPNEIPDPAIMAVAQDLLELGKAIMALSIMETTGEKATGDLARSIDGSAEQISEDEWLVSVGSPLDEAYYASMDIAWSRIERNVQVMPGRWRFIGVRPPMPAHPFIKETMAAWERALPVMLGGRMEESAARLKSSIEPLETEEP